MVEQVGIVITGVTAVFLTQSKKRSWQRYACLFGMAGQPFWIYATLSTAQWGMLIVTLLYTAAWAKGIYQHWLSKYV